MTTGLLNQSCGRMSIGNPEGWLVGSRLSCCEETSRFLRRLIHGKQLSVEGLEPGDLTPRGSLQGSKTHRESGKSALKLRDQTMTQRVSAEIKGA